jgi:hypothetical protein
MSKTLLSKLSAILASSDDKAMELDPQAEDRLEAVLEDRRDIIATLEEHLDVVAAAAIHVGGHNSTHSSQID